jgi:AraC-like DNA-binding protein
MALTRLHIKNMVCKRCILAVEQTLKELNIPYRSVHLGTAIVSLPKAEIDMKTLGEKLYEIGFELLTDKREQLTEQIKTLVIDYIHYQDIRKKNLSEFLSEKTGKDYSFLSKTFSRNEGITIERYVILQKVEKIKELLTYGEMNISEIAYSLDYSSVQHLSAQFKKITGMTPTQFKKSGAKRSFLDEIK